METLRFDHIYNQIEVIINVKPAIILQWFAPNRHIVNNA